jgi:hypothetical protein
MNANTILADLDLGKARKSEVNLAYRLADDGGTIDGEAMRKLTSDPVRHTSTSLRDALLILGARAKLDKFIGYTIGLRGLRGFGYPRAIDPMKVEFTRETNEDGDELVKLTAVSGHNLERVQGVKSVTISRAEFDARHRPGSVNEAAWAFGLLGFVVAGMRGERA